MSIRRSWFLWALIFFLVLLVAGKKLYEVQRGPIDTLGFVHFLERHWSLQKQKLDLPPTPQNLVQIFEPSFERRSFFWNDRSFQAQLVERLLKYPGPIVLNLSPKMLASSELFSSLLEKENVIKAFELVPGKSPNLEIEQQLALGENKANLPGLIHDQIGIEPDDPVYFEKKGHFGAINYSVGEADRASQFLSDYSLSLKASANQLPTILVAALQSIGWCPQLEAARVPDFIFCGARRYLNPIPLRYYQSSFARISSLEDLVDSNALLIVNPVDRTSDFPSALDRRETWSDHLATAFANLKLNQTPSYSLSTVLIELSLFFLVVACVVFSAFFLNTKSSSIVSIFAVGGFIGFDVVLSQGLGFLTQPVEPLFAIFLATGVGLSLRILKDAEDRRILDRAFAGYMSEDRLKRLLSGKESLSLEGKNRQMSFLILDLKGFSKMAAELGPKKTFEFMQRFFATVDHCIFDNHGMIDKKTGDGLLAVFGDYDGQDEPHKAARDAVQAGLDIQKSLIETKLNVDVRIGVNSGEAIIGNAGSKQHFNYTVLGDAVNFTQRLEAACPVGNVLVGSTTKRLCENDFEFQKMSIEIKNEEKLYDAFLVKPI